MKKSLLTLSAVCLLLIASCSKNKDNPEQQKNEITISGTIYPTTVIGTQTWTTVNYNGNGGVNYNDAPNDAKIGKLYSYAEAKAIVGLPAGWRVPTKSDVEKLMEHLGTSINNTESEYRGEKHLNTEKSKKITSTTGWNPSTVNGNNETKLNILPVGFYYPISDMNSNITKIYADKGTAGSFWTTTIDQNSDAVFFEVSYFKWDTKNDSQWANGIPVLGAYLVGTGMFGEVMTEKRPIRFVRDN